MSAPNAYLLTGVSAAGKSTVAQRLAERLPRAAHVRGDAFRRWIVSGRVDMSATPSAQALEQLRLRYTLLATTVDLYVANGFTAVAQDVILGPLLDDVIAMIQARPLGVVVLAPSIDAVRERERHRDKVGYHTVTPEQLDAGLRWDTPRRGLWIDTTSLSVDDTVDVILRRADPEALVG
jgi:chloramphenicol 3-O-phosphotransferase